MKTISERSLIGHGDSVIITMKRLRKRKQGGTAVLDIVPWSDRYMSDRGFLLPCNWKKLPVTDFLVVRNHPEKEFKKRS